jgi:hypothetical protein
MDRKALAGYPHNRMRFKSRFYEVYVVLANPNSPPGWAEPTWAEVSAAIDPLILCSGAKAAVRSSQLKPGPGSPNQRSISFGRIDWSPGGHKKWVHPARFSGNSKDRPEFLSTEIWSPSWGQCEKHNQPPNIYVCQKNEAVDASNREYKFNSIYLIAVAADQSALVREQGLASTKKISQITSSVLTAYQHRPWSYPAGSAFKTNSISYVTVSGLFKPGPTHRTNVSMSILNGDWQILHD